LYRITSIGIERLRYFNFGVAATGASMADNIGLSGNEKQIFEQWIAGKLKGGK
jgi:hypothetical protein